MVGGSMVLDNGADSRVEKGEASLTVLDVLCLSELVGEGRAIVNDKVRRGATKGW